MRSLVIRFEDCEGPGLLEPLLKEKGFSITYHDAYKPGLSLIPGSHLSFDFFLFLGGSSSVYDAQRKSFFLPYFQFIENILHIPGKKILGICLGSQILAHVLGGKVVRGEKGGEFGFGKLKIEEKQNPIFTGIQGEEMTGFHFHNDIFSLPPGTSRLLSSEKYDNQMFQYKDCAFGILPHFELTESMMGIWRNRFVEVKQATPSVESARGLLKEVHKSGEVLLRNIISL